MTKVAFLQPNTKVSSRAAIFGDRVEDTPEKSRHQKSTRQQQVDDDDEDEEERQSQAMLASLFKQLEGTIEVEESIFEAGDAIDTPMEDPLESIDDDQDTAEPMEFRLFASQPTPAKITIAKDEEAVVPVVERKDLDESIGSIRMKQILESAIDADTILQQAQVPWEYCQYPHKVIHISLKQQTEDPSTKKPRISKRKREWEKKVKAGLIDATQLTTTRKIKVSNSWGQPFVMRKGLDRGTIDPGTRQEIEADSKKHGHSSERGGRGRGRGGRGRGSERGGRGGQHGRGTGRGGAHLAAGPDRIPKEESKDKPDGVVPADVRSTATPGGTTGAKSKSTTSSAPTAPSIPAAPPAPASAATTVTKTTGTVPLTLKPKKAKKPKTGQTKLDSLVSMLMGN